MKKSRQRGIVYLRYIAPIAASLIMLIIMLIPVYSYTTADGRGAAVSLSELLRNSWDTVRVYIFGTTGDRDAATLHFSKVLLGIIIAAWTLFALGAISQICAAVTAIKQFLTGDVKSAGRAMFLAIVPNRVMLCVLHALTLPIFFIPALLPVLYSGILKTAVLLSCSPFDIAIIAVILYLCEVLFVAISAKYESAQGMNLFARARKESVQEYEDEEEEQQDDDGEDVYKKYESRAKQEQLDRIVELLSKKDKTENADNEEDR